MSNYICEKLSYVWRTCVNECRHIEKFIEVIYENLKTFYNVLLTGLRDDTKLRQVVCTLNFNREKNIQLAADDVIFVITGG